MEKYITKVRVLTWVVIALAVLNITTLSTIFWHRYQFRPDDGKDRDRYHISEPDRKGGIFDEKLSLSIEQKKKFSIIHRAYKVTTHATIEEMNKLRKNMIDEMKKKNIDTSVLYNYAKEIGNLNAKMKKQTVQLFLELKTECNPQQQDSLAIIFSSILQKDGMSYRSKKNMNFNKKQEFKEKKN
jgi:Spy/CpxP family protein refolding chaperone